MYIPQPIIMASICRSNICTTNTYIGGKKEQSNCSCDWCHSAFVLPLNLYPQRYYTTAD